MPALPSGPFGNGNAGPFALPHAVAASHHADAVEDTDTSPLACAEPFAYRCPESTAKPLPHAETEPGTNFAHAVAVAFVVAVTPSVAAADAPNDRGHLLCAHMRRARRFQKQVWRQHRVR